MRRLLSYSLGLAGVWLALLLAFFLIAPVLLMTGLFLVGSSVTRLAARLRRAEEAVPWHDLVEFEPEIGWRLRPNLDVYGQADDPFHLTTGPDGWRGSVAFENADVVVFGDSYAFGHGANDDEMYTRFAGDLKVKSIGSDGYDMVQAFLWMERYREQISGKLVVWMVFYGNDLWENLLPAMGHYRKPFVRRTDGGGWDIVSDHVTSDPWPFPSTRSYHEPLAGICADTSLSRRAFAATRYLVGQGSQLVDETGARLAIVGIPDRVMLTSRGRNKLQSLAPAGVSVEVGRPDAMLRSICKDLDTPFVSLAEHLSARQYLLQDIHWKTSGHRRVGAVIESLYDRTDNADTAF